MGEGIKPGHEDAFPAAALHRLELVHGVAGFLQGGSCKTSRRIQGRAEFAISCIAGTPGLRSPVLCHPQRILQATSCFQVCCIKLVMSFMGLEHDYQLNWSLLGSMSDMPDRSRSFHFQSVCYYDEE